MPRLIDCDDCNTPIDVTAIENGRLVECAGCGRKYHVRRRSRNSEKVPVAGLELATPDRVRSFSSRLDAAVSKTSDLPESGFADAEDSERWLSDVRDVQPDSSHSYRSSSLSESLSRPIHAGQRAEFLIRIVLVISLLMIVALGVYIASPV